MSRSLACDLPIVGRLLQHLTVYLTCREWITVDLTCHDCVSWREMRGDASGV